MNKYWETKVMRDGDELYLPIPDDLLANIGIVEGDYFSIEKGNNETYLLVNVTPPTTVEKKIKR